MKRVLAPLLLLVLLMIPDATAQAAACTPTGFFRDGINMTAARINPPGTVSGDVDATGCNIGVYYDSGAGKVKGAKVHGANYFGVLVNGDVNNVAVDITDSQIFQIGEAPFNGTQHGVAVYYRAFFAGSATGKVWNNSISLYQKGGIVANGRGTDASINGNTVAGLGAVGFIAQNGIQAGYGATATIMRNTVTGHSYTGSSTASGGIIVVGGAGYGTCPDGGACPYTTGAQIVGNTVADNDVGVWLSNLAADGSAPATATNVKAVNNVISSAAVTNGYPYQAGVSDVGNNDKIISNSISGAGYACAASCFEIDADASFTSRAKVHANK